MGVKAVILAAGQGTRLRPLTHDRPKSLLNVAGQPLIAHLARDLSAVGITDVVIVAGHGKDRLQAFLQDGDRFGLDVTWVFQERQLGPGHALSLVGDHVDDEFLLIPADAWYHRDMLQGLLDAPGPAMVRVADARSARHGVPVAKGGTAVDLQETGDGHPSGGAYRMPPAIVAEVTEHAFALRDAIRARVREEAWSIVDADADHYLDVIEPEDLLALHDRLMRQVERDVPEGLQGAHIEGAVSIGSGTRILPGSVVQGPAHIGNDCTIGPLAVIGPGTGIRNRTRVGPFSHVDRCTIASNVDVGSHARVVDAVIDNGARVADGAHVTGVVGADATVGVGASVRGVTGRGARVADGRRVDGVPDKGVAV